MSTERRSSSDASARVRTDGSRTAALTAVLAVVGLVAACVLIAWAARTPPSAVLQGPGPDRMSLPTTPSTSESIADETAGKESDRTSADAKSETPMIITVLSYVLTVGVLGLLMVGLLAAIWWFWSQRRRPVLLPGDQVDFEVLDIAGAVAASIVANAEEQRALLMDGAPRNAIVACWDRFEQQAARSGVRKRPWETSSEFTRRLLGEVEADPVAVRTLAARFQEARFSRHEVSEADRVAAVAALDRIHDDLRGRARAGPGLEVRR